MRRIRIDCSLELKVNHFCNNLFNKRSGRFIAPLKGLESLKRKIKGKGSRIKKRYIKEIIDNYNELLKAKPSEIDSFIIKFDNIINHIDISENFHKSITKALHYEEFRNIEYLELINEIGIKTCVYCNAQLALTINLKRITRGKRKGDYIRKGNFELDHFYPKSKYPFLATSFYNLIPCCSSCNKSKSDIESKFHLYTESNELESFIFSIDEDSLDIYDKTNMLSDLVIKFESADGDNKLLTNHQELFRISEIYDTQKDIAEELIHKSKAYTSAYKKSLVSSFRDIFPDKALIDRLVVGNYLKPSEIHKRPLSKFSQDIARQLKLIK